MRRLGSSGDVSGRRWRFRRSWPGPAPATNPRRGAWSDPPGRLDCRPRKQSQEISVHLSDRVTGAVLVALGGAAAIVGSRLPGVPGQDVGPAAFPLVIGSGLIICGALIAFGIGRSFEAPEEEDGGPRPLAAGRPARPGPAGPADLLRLCLGAAGLPADRRDHGAASRRCALGARPRLAVPHRHRRAAAGPSRLLQAAAGAPARGRPAGPVVIPT